MNWATKTVCLVFYEVACKHAMQYAVRRKLLAGGANAHGWKIKSFLVVLISPTGNEDIVIRACSQAC